MILSDRGKLESDDFYPPSGELALLVLEPIDEKKDVLDREIRKHLPVEIDIGWDSYGAILQYLR